MEQGNLIFICSYLCGGKTHLSKAIFEKYPRQHSVLIEVGEFVRNVLHKRTREELQGHPELKDDIIKLILEMHNFYENVIVSGIRQVEILLAFPQAKLIWLDNAPIILYERWLKREEEKDAGEKTPERFNKLMMGERDLGIEEVKKYIIEQNYTATI